MRAVVYLDEERKCAYSLAREHLLRARGRALFEVLSNLDGAANPSDVRVGLRAAALVRESVRLPEDPSSWMETLDYSETAG